MSKLKHLVLVLLVLGLFVSTAYSATYTVVNNNDTGGGSLRQAIIDANGNAGVDNINFNIAGSTEADRTIILLSALPIITEGVIIDGTTQTAGAVFGVSDAKIKVDGNGGTFSLIETSGANSFEIYGLYLTNTTGTTSVGIKLGSALLGTFKIGAANKGNVVSAIADVGSFEMAIKIYADGCVVQGNIIGLSPDGVTIEANGGDGIYTRAESVVIGGENPGEGNVISGNTDDGIYLWNGGEVVKGNIIGLDYTGTVDKGNGGRGIWCRISNATIGGATVGARNIISGNGAEGIDIDGSYAVVVGNYIGTDINGTAAIPNSGGVTIGLGSNATIGGSLAGERNIISGNTGNGINVNDQDVLIQGNYIGTTADGLSALGNTSSGIFFNSSSSAYRVTITNNVISANVDGIYFSSGGDTTIIKQNKIGTDKNGTANLGNSGYGIKFNSGSSAAVDVLIGGYNIADKNIIAFNGTEAILVSNDNNQIEIRKNSMFSNSQTTGNGGIVLSGAANNSKITPRFYGYTGSLLSGCAVPGDTIEIFIDTSSPLYVEGKDYVDQVIANGTGSWSYAGSFSGDYSVTGTNLGENTSAFALYNPSDIPLITTDAVNNISATTAVGDATVICDGGSAVTDRGYCWNTSSFPTIANSFSSSGSGTGVFSTTITGLTAATLYYTRAYATNSNGTEYGTEISFFTLANEPTAHITGFAASNPGAYSIDLSWTQEASASGYIIIERVGSASTFVPVDGMNYTVGQTVGDGEVAAIVGTVSSVTITSLSPSTNYYFIIIPLDWDGSNYQTYNYYTDPTIPSANETTLVGVPVYCSSAGDGGSIGNMFISQIDIDGDLAADISNLSGTCGETYSDFTAQVADVTIGSSYNFDFTGGGCMGSSTYGMVVFADWNIDGDFDDAGEKVITYDGSSTSLMSFSFTVPTGATIGLTGLRVITDRYSTSSSITPCINSHGGETEDYGLNIIYPYCLVDGTNSSNGHLKNVSLNTLNRTSTFDGFVIAPETTTIFTGDSYNISITQTNNAASGGWTAAWIDWNGDGDFLDSEEEVVTPQKDLTVGDYMWSTAITVPTTALKQQVGMRVVWKDGGETAPTPCDSYTNMIDWEDYFIDTQAGCEIVISDVVTDNLCAGDASGSVDITPSGGIPSFLIEQIGTTVTQNSSTGYPAPYGNYYWGAKHQFLIDAAEISQVYGDIGSLAFDVVTAQGIALTGFTLKMKNTAVGDLSGGFDNDDASFTQVYYSPSYTESVGWNTHVFDEAFAWDGSSNILIQVCFNNGNYTNNAIVNLDDLGYPVTAYYRADNSTVCDGTTPTSTYNTRPIMELGYGYDFSWSNGATTQDISGLAVGTYNVSVDDGGCIKTGSYTITEPPALTVDAGSNFSDCFSGSTYPIGGPPTASGGITPYTYSWNDGGANLDDLTVSNPNANPTAAGAYILDVTVTDGNTCAASSPITLDIYDNPILTGVATDVFCNGGNSGSIDLTISGGTPAYVYNWQHGPTTEDVFSLVVGNYYITVTDVNGCQVSDSYIITEPPALSVTAVTDANVSCNGGNDGQATATASGGTPTYTYAWDDPGFQTSSTAYSVPIGTFTVTVTDANGCIETDFVNITEPPALSLTISPFDESCPGLCDGSMTATESGGTAPYTYVWDDPLTQTAATATGLCVGTYTVTVTDANGCYIIDFAGIASPPALAGAYTIGGATPNYPTISDAANDLMCKGVSGPVTMNIRDGVYNEQVYIGVISGTSTSNYVTFQSEIGDSTAVTVEYTATGTGDNYVFDINGADYINLNQLSINANDANYGRGIVIQNGATDIKISNSVVKGPSATTANINKVNVYSPNTLDDGTTISNCLIIDGSYGIYLNGTTAELNTIISGNKLKDQFTYGIYCWYQEAIEVSKNTFVAANNSANYYAGFFKYCHKDIFVAKNKLDKPAGGGKGFYFDNCSGSGGQEGRIYNNMISAGPSSSVSYGLTFWSCSYQNIYHNSIRIESSDAANGRAFYTGYGSFLDIYNNIFSNFGSGYAIYVQLSPGISAMDNNDLYSTGTYVAHYDGVDYTSVGNWNAGTGFDAASISEDPLYTSNTNLHLTTPSPIGLLGGANLSSIVPADIDGSIRATTPWMGCGERIVYYWVGNAGQWSDFTNHWASSSGGAPDIGTTPKGSDYVIFDSNSFTGPLQLLEIDVNGYAKQVDFQDVTRTPVFHGTGALIIGQ
ncbi:MAG: right-handed parallel beta-helix repeat-containing protein [Flavobacteriales bacterium]|nr:right-handed parallel beta-helix repeat-containing protein [Flavobacteriales bacterium]